jgi:hypothetical protein
MDLDRSRQSAARIALIGALLAFAGRIWLLFTLPDQPVVSDTALYDLIARQLAGLSSGAPLGVFYRGFGYPAFLAGLYKLGLGYTGVRLVQALLWSVAIGLVTYASGRRFGPRPALITAALLLVIPKIWLHFVWLFAENLLVVELAGLWTILLLRKRGNTRSAVGFGVVLALVVLTHIGWQPFVPVAVVALWHKRDALVGLTTSVAVILAVLVPLHIIYPGQPWQSGKGNSGYGGGSAWTFYVGTHTKTQGTPTPGDFKAANKHLHSDSWYWHHGIDAVVSSPLDSASLLANKLWSMWAGAAAGYATNSKSVDYLSRDINAPLCVLMLFTGLLGGLIVFRRDRWLGIVLVLPAVWATVLFSVLATYDTRYVLPTMPLMAIPAGVALAGQRPRTI